jgi:peptidyl-prolyl cis-trans isomerase B (cyclophilin B)
MKNFIFSIFITSLFLTIGCKSEPTKAVIETRYGNITVELSDSTPIHRDNFIKLVKEGFYDELLFHRVIKGFMVQGGDPDSKDAPLNKRLGMSGPGYTIEAEIGLLHYRGALAAARKGGSGNPDKRSSGSQFYIVDGLESVSEKDVSNAKSKNGLNYTQEQIDKYKEQGGYPFLDNEYTVFGRVIDGMDVVEKITNVEKISGDRPKEDIKMKIKLLN